jgi:hypothetical protein
MMNVGFHRRGVGSQLAAFGHLVLLGYLHDSIVKARGSILAKEAKRSGKTGKNQGWRPRKSG